MRQQQAVGASMAFQRFSPLLNPPPPPLVSDRLPPFSLFGRRAWDGKGHYF